MDSFVTSVSISCVILPKLFHIKIRKISFCHNASVKVNSIGHIEQKESLP